MAQPDNQRSTGRAGTHLIRAACLAPMAPGQPEALIRDAALLITNGTITAVGPAKSLPSTADQITDLPGHLLLPGLINAHTHLELSLSKPGPPPKSFADWLGQVITSATQAEPARAVAEGLRQCQEFGITTIADITRNPAATRPILRDASIRAISFGEVRAMAQRRHQLRPALTAALQPPEKNTVPDTVSSFVKTGLSPHSPYSTEPAAYRACLEAAQRYHLPLTTHLAESPDEAEFLAHHTGPLRRLWDSLGWDDAVPTFQGGPIRLAASLGLLAEPTILAHVNYCDDVELDLLAAGRASVVYCPRTHRFFGHPPHRFRDMLARNINVTLGTDSCASSPNLNLLDDVRLVHEIHPDLTPTIILEMATHRAAAALGLAQTCGSLTPGRGADIVAFAMPTDEKNPLRSILESDARPTQVWLDGQNVARTP